MDVTIRLATLQDAGALERLIRESVMQLQAQYTVRQRESALGGVFGVDRQLIRDGTYFVVESGGELAGCGGWSRRKTPFGGDHSPAKDDALLDPAVDAAKIRAFFVHPAWARRGIGTKILRACEEAAAAEGFRQLELVSTLAGIPLYTRHGFVGVEEFEVPLEGDEALPVLRMRKVL